MQKSTLQQKRLRKVKSSQLFVISEDQEFSRPKQIQRFSPKAFQSIKSPKKKENQKENFNLNQMNSQQLKMFVQFNPFMRAKLKCLINTTKKSLGKQNEVLSPKFRPRNKFQQLSNMSSIRVLEKERKAREKVKIQDYEKLVNGKQSRRYKNEIAMNKQNF